MIGSRDLLGRIESLEQLGQRTNNNATPDARESVVRLVKGEHPYL